MNARRSRRRPLSASEIRKGTNRRLTKYEKLGFLEHFAMFMGMTQILELNLKRLLSEWGEYDFDAMDRWTLGRVARELRQSGLREDFLVLLDGVVAHRNYVAHELLANEMMLVVLMRGNTGRWGRHDLYRATYELEQLMFLHDVTAKYKAWGRRAAREPLPVQPAYPAGHNN